MRLALKFWSVLSQSQKRGAIGIVGLMILSTLFEMLGIGLILPGLTILSGSKSGPQSAWVAEMLEAVGNPSRRQLVLWGALVLLALYLLKGAVVLLTAYRQAGFVRQLDKSLCQQLFDIYLHQPWTFHLQRNSAELIRNITNTSGIADACASVMNSLAEFLIVAGIALVLLWIDPLATVLVGGMAIASTWLLDRTFKQRSRRWGDLRMKHHGYLTQAVHQGLGGVKDAKMRGCEDYFLRAFSHHAATVARVNQRQMFTFSVPRVWHELVGVTAVCLLTLILIWQGKPLEQFIPTLGVFAAAGFRMLPAINRLSISLNMMNFWEPTVDNMVSELALPREFDADASVVPIEFLNQVCLEGVTFRYDGAKAPALAGVSIVIPHGSAVGIVGTSGAGKSTLVDVLLGLLRPDGGRITIDGVDLAGRERAWQRLVGYVPQSIYLCDDTIRANVAFGVSPREIDDEAVERAIRGAQLDGFVADLPEGLDTVVGERGVRLSGGQRQRIGIARALYHDPKVLVLDEATSSLDTETEKGVMEAVEVLHGAKTLVIVAHRLSTVANCDVLYRLEKGRVVSSGSFQEVTTA